MLDQDLIDSFVDWHFSQSRPMTTLEAAVNFLDEMEVYNIDATDLAEQAD